MGNWGNVDPELEERLKTCVDDFHADRGRFLNSYSQVEYLALDIANKLKNVVQYVRFAEKFPRSTGKRIEVLENILSTNGPLQPYNSTVLKMKNLLEDNSDIRHYLAHGFSQVTYGRGGYLGVELLRYKPDSKDPWEPCKLIYEFSEFQYAVAQTSKIAEEVLHECRQLYSDLHFETNLMMAEN